MSFQDKRGRCYLIGQGKVSAGDCSCRRHSVSVVDWNERLSNKSNQAPYRSIVWVCAVLTASYPTRFILNYV